MPDEQSQTRAPGHVVALVASAGGLKAMQTVLAQLPGDLDAAVIVLIHQEPDRASHLADILSRSSTLPVVAAAHDQPLRAGTVIIAQPGLHVLVTPGPRIATIASGSSPPNRPSADLLLTTLAIACGPRAVAVVLSGGGHDGATGATAVHDFGGIVVASDQASSTHFAMPRATIERAGVIDRVVAVGDVAALLASVAGAAAR